ncbi:inorganic phosphate transporter [Pandoraea sp. ISTKB]|uniref:inorganic phosphate transporter n=1 Tax=Pandoraea sp. ISTKB TaxID=1586708 RepID=UPI0009F3EFF2|nr:inorganic phosphate transporter [Pandoraea sp. ISTKB]
MAHGGAPTPALPPRPPRSSGKDGGDRKDLGGEGRADPTGVPLARARRRRHRIRLALFLTLLLAGLTFTTVSLVHDVGRAGEHSIALLPFLLLVVALLIALGFEFVNGFHDTANAVATVIYTNSLPPSIAVMWSGLFNFLGVLLSSGAVAFSVVALLPVELILQVGSSAGFAMVFALLISAILWNAGTWWLGLPASSSHTLIGSIVGVGIANALMHGRDGTSGIDWEQVTSVGYSLLLSPVIGFGLAAALFIALKVCVRNPALYASPEPRTPPPWWIRGILILTCTGVSFAHGSNDGQKGMGLIMLILVGTVPIAYALNHAMPDAQVAQFAASAQRVQRSLAAHPPLSPTVSDIPAAAPARDVLTGFIRTEQFTPEVVPALSELTGEIGHDIASHGSFARVPATSVANVRNDMYIVSETIRLLERRQDTHDVRLAPDTERELRVFRGELDTATKYIPFWVKVSVAVALGLGTMVGWRRIVVTVGERIGKKHLTYAQGASAEVVAMMTIGAADMFGMPVSTTHVLSSGVAGTMTINGAGLQWDTIRNLLLAWVLTLPAAIVLAGGLYWGFRQLF